MRVPDSHRPEENGQTMNTIVFIAVMLAVGLLYLVFVEIRHGVSQENCHMAGFRNCKGDLPIITSPHRRDKLE